MAADGNARSRSRSPRPVSSSGMSDETLDWHTGRPRREILQMEAQLAQDHFQPEEGDVLLRSHDEAAAVGSEGDGLVHSQLEVEPVQMEAEPAEIQFQPDGPGPSHAETAEGQVLSESNVVTSGAMEVFEKEATPLSKVATPGSAPSTYTKMLDRQLASAEKVEVTNPEAAELKRALAFDDFPIDLDEPHSLPDTLSPHWDDVDLESPPRLDGERVEVGELPELPAGVLQRGLSPPAMSNDDVRHRPVLAWRDELLKDFLPLFKDAGFLRPLKMSTCCSGTGAPRLALGWCGVPFEERVACDPKKSSMVMAQNMNQVATHHLGSATDLAQGCGYCEVHLDVCHGLGIEQDDLFVSGFPCQPFSTQRPCRWARPWQEHSEAHVMKDVAESMAARQPLLGVLENVPGFLRAQRRSIMLSACVCVLAVAGSAKFDYTS
eukprot:Skav234137  [mRNA]  locus=scaffold5409:56437:57741:+ [translate_table: standard]